MSTREFVKPMAHVMGMATRLGLEELRKMAPQIRDDRNVGA